MTAVTPDEVTRASARPPSEQHEPYIAATLTLRELTRARRAPELS